MDNYYGKLMIHVNVPRLMNEIVIEVQKGGQIIYEG